MQKYLKIEIHGIITLLLRKPTSNKIYLQPMIKMFKSEMLKFFIAEKYKEKLIYVYQYILKSCNFKNTEELVFVKNLNIYVWDMILYKWWCFGEMTSEAIMDSST